MDRFLEPWNRHDVDGALALMTDDCVWEVTRGREPHGTLYTGQTAVRSAIVEAFKALPDVNYQPVRNSFGEDHVVVADASKAAIRVAVGEPDFVRWATRFCVAPLRSTNP